MVRSGKGCRSSGLVLPMWLVWHLTASLCTSKDINRRAVHTLTRENFVEVTAGKNVFIKFYEPACEHSQKLAPVWEKLAEDWVRHPLVLIAELNCRENKRAERFCHEEIEIFGVPTLLFGEPSRGGEYLQSYGDEKTYDALTSFVNETLSESILCSPGNTEGCAPEMQKQLEYIWTLSPRELRTAIDEKELEIRQAHINFKSEFQRMQEIYDRQANEYEKTIAAIRTKVKMLKSVHTARIDTETKA